VISIAFALAAIAVAVALWWFVPRLRAWPPSLGLLVAVFTVVPPHETIALGVGADDLLLVIGLVLLLPSAFRNGWQVGPVPIGRWLLVGAGLLMAGMTISAFVNEESLVGTLALLIRGPGRVLLYVLVVLAVLVQRPFGETRWVVSRALAGVGVFEALVSIWAYFIGFPGGFGLEETRGNTSLLGEIPGRVNGTLALSPNFLGALLVLAVPLTLGIALDAARRSRRLGALWSIAVVLQLIALVLTYTRSSLAVAAVACAVVLALRARLRWLVAGVVVVIGLVALTPAFQRILHDQTDRMALYSSALKVFGDHPLAGVGPGEQATFTAADPERYRATSYGVAGNNAHNTVLLAAAEDGVLGLVGALVLNVAMAAIAVAVVWRARADGEKLAEPLGIAVALIAFLLQGMANNLFTVTLTASALVLLLAGGAIPWLGERVGPGGHRPGDVAGERSAVAEPDSVDVQRGQPA
jgi:hypothetical protein